MERVEQRDHALERPERGKEERRQRAGHQKPGNPLLCEDAGLEIAADGDKERIAWSHDGRGPDRMAEHEGDREGGDQNRERASVEADPDHLAGSGDPADGQADERVDQDDRQINAVVADRFAAGGSELDGAAPKAAGRPVDTGGYDAHGRSASGCKWLAVLTQKCASTALTPV